MSAVASLPQRPVVIVADDDDDERELMVRTLRRAGFEPFESRDGNELLEIAERYGASICLVVSDIGMPAIDGIAATRELQSLLPGAPVILVTAFADEFTLGAARRVGARRVLRKPFAMSELVDAAFETTASR